MTKDHSFQNIIFTLQQFWHSQGCVILQPYDMEVGAGTFHPSTALYPLGPKPIYVAHVQPSRRPGDGRYGENPNRMSRFHQFQVVLKPAPENILELYLESLRLIGIDDKQHDIRFVEDDWESPTLGAWGLGWEVWCDGMEVTQFTYMQQIGGIDCEMISGEIAYGLERLAMVIQDKENIYDLEWNKVAPEMQGKAMQYHFADLCKQAEYEYSKYNLEIADTEILKQQFSHAEQESLKLASLTLPIPAYEQCIKASHLFNLLDSRGVIGVNERAGYIGRVRHMAKNCCEAWVKTQI